MVAYHLNSARLQSLVDLLRQEDACIPADIAHFLTVELVPHLAEGRYLGTDPLLIPLGGAFGEAGALHISAEKVVVRRGATGTKGSRDIRELNEKVTGLVCAPLVPRCQCPACLRELCHFCGKGPARESMMLPHKVVALLCLADSRSLR